MAGVEAPTHPGTTDPAVQQGQVVIGNAEAAAQGRYLEQVDAVTKEQADAALRRRLSTENLVVAITGTHAQIGEKIAAAVPGLASQSVVPFDLE